MGLVTSGVRVRPSARSRRTPRSTPDRPIKLWPSLALLPIIVVGTVKATGFDSLGGVDTTILSVVLVLMASVTTFLRHPRYPVQQMLPFLLFAMVVLLGIALSEPGEYQSLKSRDFFFLTGVVVWCIPVILRDVRDLRGLFVAWFVGGAFVAALVPIVGGAKDLYGRAGIGEATLGPAYLAAVAVVVGGAALGEKLLPPVLVLPGVAVSGVVLFMIGSRGPLIGATLGFLTWILLRGVLNPRSLAVLGLMAGVVLIGLREASEAALSHLVLEDPAREELWATAGRAFLENPVFGLGWGGYAAVNWIDEYPHNLFMETAAELGMVGLICLLVLLAMAARGVWRTRSAPEARIVAAVAVVMFMGQQFSSDLTYRVFWIALIPCLLLPAIEWRQDTRPTTESTARSGRSATRPQGAAFQQPDGPLPRGTRAMRAGRPRLWRSPGSR